jgi:hypothetical protein
MFESLALAKFLERAELSDPLQRLFWGNFVNRSGDCCPDLMPGTQS